MSPVRSDYKITAEDIFRNKFPVAPHLPLIPDRTADTVCHSQQSEPESQCDSFDLCTFDPDFHCGSTENCEEVIG